MVITSGDVSFYLITGNVQKVTKWFPGVEITFTLQVEICFIVPYSQIIKKNNKIIKINDQISRIKLTTLQIRPRLTCIGS